MLYEPEPEVLQTDTNHGRLRYRKRQLLKIFKVHSQRKRTLVEAETAAGYRTELITLEVGSRGMLCVSDLDPLRETIKTTSKEATSLCLDIIRTTLLQSFRIGTSRNLIN